MSVPAQQTAVPPLRELMLLVEELGTMYCRMAEASLAAREAVQTDRLEDAVQAITVRESWARESEAMLQNILHARDELREDEQIVEGLLSELRKAAEAVAHLDADLQVVVASRQQQTALELEQIEGILKKNALYGSAQGGTPQRQLDLAY